MSEPENIQTADDMDDFSTVITMLDTFSRSQTTAAIVNCYLENNQIDPYMDPEKITAELLSFIQHEFRTYNKDAPKDVKFAVPKELEPFVIAEIMLKMYYIKNINYTGNKSEKEYILLGMYQEDGPDKGIYISYEAEIHNIIRRFCPAIDDKGIKQIMSILNDKADIVERCSDRDLIAVNNGIFNYRTKILEPFDPEKVFTAKCRVDYNPTATNVVIHNDQDNTDWDVESWILELFDDPEIAECIWQIMGAVIRPNVRWGKAAWLVSESGNNGKGSLCSILRNLVGQNSYAAIPMSEMGKDFMLEPLIRVTAIITDENDVGDFLDKSANLKAIVTNDTVMVNRKFKKPISLQFKGFMVQCVNEVPRTQDRTASFYRRCLFIPFKKCYTGIERKYIKDDYLNRKEVLEYVLYRVLHMDYYEITEPAKCREALEEYKTFNNPIRNFAIELLQKASWGCFSGSMIYTFYKGWSKINNPSGSIPGRNSFLKEFVKAVDFSQYGWTYQDKKQRVGDRMSCDEPLLEEFEYEEMCTKKDRQLICARRLICPPSTAKGLFKDNWVPKKNTGGLIISDDDNKP